MSFYIQSCDISNCCGIAEYPFNNKIICGFHSRQFQQDKKIYERVRKLRVSKAQIKHGYYYYYACIVDNCCEEAEYAKDYSIPTNCYEHEGYKMCKIGSKRVNSV